MDDAVEQKRCADLKGIYSKCFNTWYTEKFLKGDTSAACQVEFEAYRVSHAWLIYVWLCGAFQVYADTAQECVRKSLKAKQLDYLLDDTKAAPGSGDAAGSKT